MSVYDDIASLIKGYVNQQVTARRVMFSGVVTAVNVDQSVNVQLDSGAVLPGLLAPRPVVVGEVVSVIVDGQTSAIL